MRRRPPPPAGPSGVYIHLPFCRRRCSFCDFPIVVGHDDESRYVDALVREIAVGQSGLPGPVDSFYLGGGTPSLLAATSLERVCAALASRFGSLAAAEVTLEANPEDVDATRISTWESLGINRISLGVQSLDDEVLSGCGRLHRRVETLQAIERLISRPSLRLSVDLIAGLPGETDAGFVEGLERVLERGVRHVSLYLLELEKETPLARRVRAGTVRLADGATLEARHVQAVSRLSAAGLDAYEIASFAAPAERCRHNLKYWSDVDYAGFGMGAHGYLRGRRRGNLASLTAYLDRVGEGRDPIDLDEPWDPARRLAEAVMCALRRVEGLSVAAFRNRWEVDVAARWEGLWRRASRDGLLERTEDRLALSAAGRLRADVVFSGLFGDVRFDTTPALCDNERLNNGGSTMQDLAVDSAQKSLDFRFTDDQDLLRRTVREFAETVVRPDVMKFDESQEFPLDIMKQAGELGLLGLLVPEEFGGTGLGYIEYAMVVEEISRVCGSVGISVAAHNGLGTNHICRFGTDEQRRKYVSRFATGEWIAGWSLTEPSAGSDAGGTRATAVEDGDSWVLNGAKTFCTHGSVGDAVVVFAVTDKDRGKRGISAFVIEKGHPGFTAGKKEDKMGLRASDTSEVIMQDCRIPADQIVGERGSGFIDAMKILDGGRISIAALALGMAKGAYEAALKYSTERQQFGRPISDFQAIQFMLADMATKIDAAELLTYRAAWRKDSGLSTTRESAMAKLYASEIGVEVADKALQIFGGYGYCKDYPAEKYYRDMKLCTIGEGTSEIQRIVIAREVLKAVQ